MNLDEFLRAIDLRLGDPHANNWGWTLLYREAGHTGRSVGRGRHERPRKARQADPPGPTVPPGGMGAAATRRDGQHQEDHAA